MNRLAEETSPYLRQHADNPVDWYPWGDDAFAAARAEDKPILLSVGYSSCHWCHVMAHESFEDPETAAVMNRLFVNVKVDREQRPDVDAIYMQAVQAMTGHGGWPMTVFLDHDGRPFYGGTYFPKTDRQGMPGFQRVMEAIHEAWTERREEIDEQAEQLRTAIDRTTRIGASIGAGPVPATARCGRRRLSPTILDRAVARATAQFDARFGGFGRAPKFPQAMTHDFLLRADARHPSDEVLQVVTVSLDAMAAGGMYDQVGGGFHRYSVDDFWLVPHFEKMLYDQALLTGAYLRGYLATGEPRYRRVVEDTIEYVLRDLRHPDGGFFSAEDADSEGIEGKFYLWSLEEITALARRRRQRGDPLLRRDRRRQLRRPAHRLPRHDPARRRPHRGPARRGAPRDPAPARSRARSACGRGSTTRCCWRGTRCSCDRSWRPRPRSAATTGWTPRTRTSRSSSRRCAATTAGSCARGRTGAAGHPRVRRGLRRAGRGAAHPRRARRRRVVARGAPRRRRDAGAVRRRRAGRRVHHRHRRRGAHRAPEGLPGQRDAVGELDGRERAAAAGRAHGRRELRRRRASLARRAGAGARRPPHRVRVPARRARPRRAPVDRGRGRRRPQRSRAAADSSVRSPAASCREACSSSAAPTVGTELSPLLQHRDMIDGRPTAYVCRDYACELPVTEPAALRAQLDAALGR